jgi:anti-anti-sigma factor
VIQEPLPEGHWLIAVRGEIDIGSGAALQQALTDAVDEGRHSIIVDLTRTTFMGSTGASALAHARRRLLAHNGRMVIVTAHPSVTQVLHLTHLDELVTVVATRSQALHALTDAPE